ncbi:DUF2889 domain-containing protein [Amycolatopsis acidiphila]|uniref:DUF2889 domain-containing protein n=1 Tax=Amycolatopsis acidiphila TaxID=715473 RepID=A0A558AP68_9PSEU|nr:DUF2889 domain-containing protein [Amycolatopsis acidiphila]TVT26063.1 DUF2889 domain-containing protein [Amycolatopsis acidiphila]UIJ63214.1 DUF2889 domain-containing protein [Amycolatopsis acidiphila]GHG74389.1 hypothetical protein GCM10017788_38320 [Amycolatopsis acidiphila]
MVLESLPALGAGALRRTVSLQVTPDPDWRQGLWIAATGRDIAAEGSRAPGTRELAVAIDARNRITAVTGELPPRVAEALLGTSPVSGFRARLDALPGLVPGSLESVLLDDLPTVRLVSGYAAMMEYPQLFQGPGRRSPMLGICAGWAEGATADRRARAGGPLLSSAPRARALEAMLPGAGEFHAEPPGRPSSMWRRRILDVTPRAGGYDVFEYFRDSYVDPEGLERSLHEYSVRARVAADAETVEDVEVTPHALPFPECPLAAPNARDLVGTSLREVSGTVRSRLSGTRGCTHLNDVLRFLRCVPVLTAV